MRNDERERLEGAKKTLAASDTALPTARVI